MKIALSLLRDAEEAALAVEGDGVRRLAGGGYVDPVGVGQGGFLLHSVGASTAGPLKG